MNCADHEVRLILHDPVSARLSQHMTASWQTLRDGNVLCAPVWGCGFCRQDNHWLVAKIALFDDASGRLRKVFQLARDGVAELFLNPKDRRHLSFIRGQIPKPRTGYQPGLSRCSSTDQPHQTARNSLCP